MPTEPIQAWKNYWATYAAALAQPLQGNGLLSRFVKNPPVTGAFAEAWVRGTARTMLGGRYRLSTGAVIRSSDYLGDLHNVPQCDLIIWDPSELPGLFEQGEFALVPYASVRAVIEVKRTLSSREELEQQLRDRQDLAPKGRVLGVVVSHGKSLFDATPAPDWLRRTSKSFAMTRLLDEENEPDVNGVMAFIYFLSQLAGHTREIVVSS